MNNSIGALWVKEGQKGDFYKGYVENEEGERMNIVIFKNNYKNADNQPDYRIMKAEKKEEQKVEQKQEEQEDDLPF